MISPCSSDYRTVTMKKETDSLHIKLYMQLNLFLIMYLNVIFVECFQSFFLLKRKIPPAKATTPKPN